MDFINELIREKKSLAKRIDAIDLLLQSYNVTSEITTTSSNNATETLELDYKEELKKLSNSNKFLLVLKKHQRFMRVREIGEYITSQIGGSTNDWVIKLSRRTRNLKIANKIIKQQVGTKRTNAFWGSPNWIDENGNIKKEYMYDENSIKSKSTQAYFDL